jgi:hypothetical protein
MTSGSPLAQRGVMNTSLAKGADTRRPPSTLALRLAAFAGLLGGCALVVDTVTIAVINDSFGMLDSLLFWVGLIGLLVTLFALATALSAHASGARRLARGLGVFLAGILAIGVLAQVMDTMGHHVFSPSNQGLHGEWSFFTVGVCLLLIAGWSNRAGSPGTD